jgi:hypothetical protein
MADEQEKGHELLAAEMGYPRLSLIGRNANVAPTPDDIN